jgi:hypothetical protein
VDLKEYIAATTPAFDDPQTAAREAFSAAAVILQGKPRFAAYLGWSATDVNALAQSAIGWRTSAPPMLRKLTAAGLTEQVEAYAQFLVQVTRLACVQFAPGDPAAERTASAIAATVTRFAPVSNTRLEPDPAPAEQVEDLGRALDDLERLVGLEAAKREINQQVQLIRITQMRAAAGLRNPTVSRHLVFVGNPGTGKTTVARIVGRIYKALKVVPDGHLVETDASGLVAGYVGQTALKTAEQIDAALGGLLFVDEAYGLTRNDFGIEAIDTLVKAMEDHRDELVVIVAGYTVEMGEFLNANPGLQSRFPTTITFADYSAEELVLILGRIAADNDYTLPDDPRLAQAVAAKMTVPGFGNAREMRNLFEAAVRRQAWRLKDVADVSVEQMKALTAEDLLG